MTIHDDVLKKQDIDRVGHNIKHTNGKIVSSVTQPEKALALAILNKAKEDAENGDIAALAFLLLDGLRLESLIMPYQELDRRQPADSMVLRFVEKTWQKLEKDGHFFDKNTLAKEVKKLREELKGPCQVAFTREVS